MWIFFNRFNLEDKNVDFQYDYSPSPSSNSSSDILMGGNQNSIIQSDIKNLETFAKGKAMMRRNSDNSIMLTEIPNFAKNSKLKPLNHDDNQKQLTQQFSKGVFFILFSWNIIYLFLIKYLNLTA